MTLFALSLCGVSAALSFGRSSVRMASGDLNAAQRAFEAKSGGRVFETLVEYPCVFKIKVIGRDDPSFVDDVVSYIGRVTDTAPANISFSTAASRQGTFVSVSVEAPVANANELYECYSVLRNDPRVKVAL
ncbi:hypothetical protein CTAYLR_000998 [Chrysophaeum taylorii]|uniref:DUF493 domain-containing protein n=1 Tax=Chrysophaeum taylorii TaxID=2483200 RepID=A0AAD7XMQ3_9STRA|nr:hypothetical protein CTAYLR_000998 [Chrysophaeum taylorii]